MIPLPTLPQHRQDPFTRQNAGIPVAKQVVLLRGGVRIVSGRQAPPAEWLWVVVLNLKPQNLKMEKHVT